MNIVDKLRHEALENPKLKDLLFEAADAISLAVETIEVVQHTLQQPTPLHALKDVLHMLGEQRKHNGELMTLQCIGGVWQARTIGFILKADAALVLGKNNAARAIEWNEWLAYRKVTG